MKKRQVLTMAERCLVAAGVASVSAIAASSAVALDARISKDASAAAPAVWAAVGDFCGIATWHPAVAKCELSNKDGKTYRTLTLKDGAKLLEKLTAFDAAAMTYSYTIEEGPLPVANYVSTLKVVAKDKGATIDWSGTFDAKGAPDADAIKTISGIYAGGIDALIAKTAK
jgi:Polyketide cyclase / dehydrase and lipid transport